MDESYQYHPVELVAIDKRLSAVSVSTSKRNEPQYAVNRINQKYDSYQDFLCKNNLTRRRLSSTGGHSGDSSTQCSGSSYGEAEEGSEGRPASEESDEKSEEENKPIGRITDLERQKVETFFKGLKTQVFVSNSLANLYLKNSSEPEWQLKYTGIPVVILDVGECRARNRRKIQIALAERGTCFMLWSDTIDNLSSYKVDGPAFHTMRYSSDHTTEIGFSFDSNGAADEMWSHIERLVACPENISLSTPGKKKKKKEKKPTKQSPLPAKCNISQPCCFQHITSVDKEDTSRYFSLKELLPRELVESPMSQ